MWFLLTQTETLDFLSQIVKIFSEDGMGKVVEIPANMTARDLCQLLVYKSHCVDDNSWALVEHHPLLGLGKEQSRRGLKTFSVSHTDTHPHEHTWTDTLIFPHRNPWAHGWAQTCNSITELQVHWYLCMHACMHARILGLTVEALILTQACIQAWVHARKHMHAQSQKVHWSYPVSHSGCVESCTGR